MVLSCLIALREHCISPQALSEQTRSLWMEYELVHSSIGTLILLGLCSGLASMQSRRLPCVSLSCLTQGLVRIIYAIARARGVERGSSPPALGARASSQLSVNPSVL